MYIPREILGAGSWRGTIHTIWRNVIPSFIWKSLNKESLPLDNNGETSRDFIYVNDIIQGLILCAEKGQPGEVYNLGSGIETSIKDLAIMINELTGNLTPITLMPGRDWDRSGKRFGSTLKSKKELGFVNKTSLYEGLKETLSWTKSNQRLIKYNIDKHQPFLNSNNQ